MNIQVTTARGRAYWVHVTRIIGTSGPDCAEVWENTDFLTSPHSSIGSHSDYGHGGRGWVGEVVSRRAEPGLPVGEARFSWYANRRRRQVALCSAIIRRAGLPLFSHTILGFQLFTDPMRDLRKVAA